MTKKKVKPTSEFKLDPDAEPRYWSPTKEQLERGLFWAQDNMILGWVPWSKPKEGISTLPGSQE